MGVEPQSLIKPHCGIGGAVAAGKNAGGSDHLRRKVEGEIGTGSRW
jgi:hypothetical protein